MRVEVANALESILSGLSIESTDMLKAAFNLKSDDALRELIVEQIEGRFDTQRKRG